MKTAYQTDKYGLLVGETIADESPLEPGVYHVPAGATLTPPPVDWPAGKWPRWNGHNWELVTKPEQPADDPVEKLAAFLAQNPDVAALINSTDGGANV